MLLLRMVNTDLLLVSSAGKSIRFTEDDVRAMGRNATGVRGIKLAEGQQVVSLITIKENMTSTDVLVATENGYGKRTDMSEYPVQKRGGQGCDCDSNFRS